MKKVISAILAASMVMSMGVMASAKTAAKTITWNSVDGSAATYTMFSDTKEGADNWVQKDTVVSDTDIYVRLKQLGAGFDLSKVTDEDYYKFSSKKGDNSKMIKSISLVEKDFGMAGREPVVKIALAEDQTDTDYKMNPEFTLKGKADADKTEYRFVVKFWVKNGVETTDDLTNTAGATGYVAKPIKNEDNTVTWEDNNNTLATMTFEADSDVNKYYPKLSTKWNNADYEAMFADQDAYIRDFVGNPTISSTSRPKVEINNPFYDSDDDASTVAMEDVVIYQVMEDGTLADVTASFTASTNDDGDEVFTIKTRTLGTYIFAEKAASSAADEAPVEVPADDVKVVPNTGRI